MTRFELATPRPPAVFFRSALSLIINYICYCIFSRANNVQTFINSATERYNFISFDATNRLIRSLCGQPFALRDIIIYFCYAYSLCDWFLFDAGQGRPCSFVLLVYYILNSISCKMFFLVRLLLILLLQ